MDVDLDRLIETLDAHDKTTLAAFVRALVRAGRLVLPHAPPSAEILPAIRFRWDTLVLCATKYIGRYDQLLTVADTNDTRSANVVISGISSGERRHNRFATWDFLDRHGQNADGILLTVNGRHFRFVLYPDGSRQWTIEGNRINIAAALNTGDEVVLHAPVIEFEE